MTTLPSRSSIQTLLDQFGVAISSGDVAKVLQIRQVLDKKIEDLFIEAERAKRPPPPPPKSAGGLHDPWRKPTAKTPSPKPPKPPHMPPKPLPCPECNGQGVKEEGNAFLKCQNCHGTGKVYLQPPGTTPVPEADIGEFLKDFFKGGL